MTDIDSQLVCGKVANDPTQADASGGQRQVQVVLSYFFFVITVGMIYRPRIHAQYTICLLNFVARRCSII
jgi:hypothetical protein